MKSIIKRFFTFSICVVFCQVLSTNIVFAKENITIKQLESSESKQLEVNIPKDYEISERVPLDKTWNIKFNQEINEQSIDGNIKILNDTNGQPVKFKAYLDKESKKISIYSQYKSNNSYTLIIDKSLKSKRGHKLGEGINIKFKTMEEQKSTIKYIENINLSVDNEEQIELPSTVNAVMSDGESKEVQVQWNKNFKDFNENRIYLGEVDGYSGRAILNLTINSKNKGEEMNTDDFNNHVQDPTEISGQIEMQQYHSQIHKNLVEYLSNGDNRNSVMNRAIELHGGDERNTCVYFASEALRRAGLTDLPKWVCNTIELTKQLETRGWKKSSDLSQLRPGDICFTISYGYGPTHTYTFMSWIDIKSHEYAYVCDNQRNEYGNSYHKRSVKFATTKMDPISYFMYMP